MIDPAIAASFARIAARERDVMGAYRPGFIPESSDVASRSNVQPSADPLGVVAPEGTYFVTPGADGVARFSRDGGFVLEGGELRAPGGAPVLGIAFGRGSTLAPLRVDPYDAALGHASGARIDADGTFSYARTSVDPRTGERRAERVAVGRIALARFPAGSEPERVDGAHVRAPHGVVPHVGLPADGTFTALATHARDLGRVDIIASIEKMNDAYRSLEALRSAERARGSLEKQSMDLLK